MVHLLYKNSGENGKRTMDMWATDQIMEQDTLEVGYHLFKCPMLALQAEESIRPHVNTKELDEKERAFIMKKSEYSMFYKIDKETGLLFVGHFPAWTYDDWKLWTEHPQGCPAVE